MLLNKNIPCCCLASFKATRIPPSTKGAEKQNLARKIAISKDFCLPFMSSCDDTGICTIRALLKYQWTRE